MRLPLLAVLVLLAAGCGGGSSDGTADTGGGAGSAPVDYRVFASEFAFAPPFVSVDKPGTYTFSLRNDGTLTHNLTVRGVGETADVAPGDTATVTLTLKPGVYEMYCSVDSHRAQGMDGQVTVHGG